MSGGEDRPGTERKGTKWCEANGHRPFRRERDKGKWREANTWHQLQKTIQPGFMPIPLACVYAGLALDFSGTLISCLERLRPLVVPNALLIFLNFFPVMYAFRQFPKNVHVVHHTFPLGDGVVGVFEKPLSRSFFVIPTLCNTLH